MEIANVNSWDYFLARQLTPWRLVVTVCSCQATELHAITFQVQLLNLRFFNWFWSLSVGFSFIYQTNNRNYKKKTQKLYTGKY